MTVSLQKESRAERLFKEIMAENVPNLVKDTHLKTEEAELTLNKINTKKYIEDNR